MVEGVGDEGGGNTRTCPQGHVLVFGTCGDGLWEARGGASARFREVGAGGMVGLLV